jgi:hypothetical protein
MNVFANKTYDAEWLGYEHKHSSQITRKTSNAGTQNTSTIELVISEIQQDSGNVNSQKSLN